MQEAIQFLAEHGYWLLPFSIVARQACLPIPTNLLLLAAGALAQSGKLSLVGILVLSVLSFVLADFVLYQGGRLFGSTILRLVSGDLHTTIQWASDRFKRNGASLLLFSKFVIGLDAIAVPLAGASGVTMKRFLVFDALGATLWSTAYIMLGYLFAHQLELIAAHAVIGAKFMAAILTAAIGFYMTRRFFRRRRVLEPVR